MFYQPKRVAIREGYHGCHASIAVYKKSRGADFQIIDLDDEYQEGDLCWLETPLNPTGEARCVISGYIVWSVSAEMIFTETFSITPTRWAQLTSIIPIKLDSPCADS